MRSLASFSALTAGLFLSLDANRFAHAEDDDSSRPCEEISTEEIRGTGDFSGVEAGAFGSLEQRAGEDCDVDEALLFPAAPARDGPDESGFPEPQGAPDASRTSFALSRRTAGAGTDAVLRHRADLGAWSHAFEVRGDTLARRRVVWASREARGRELGWRVAVGDMTDTALRAWPRGLPRRALPAGWKPAHGTPEAPVPWSAPVPQGFAAGVFHGGWGAYALRARNPVTTGGEPPWHPAWTLHHEAAGAAAPLFSGSGPGAGAWRLSLHGSATRVTRPAFAPPQSDTAASPPERTAITEHPLSERVLAAELLSPRRGAQFVAALSDNDRAGADQARRGGLLGLALHKRWGEGGRLPHAGTWEWDVTARQRTAGWASAWDPAVTATLLEERFGTRAPDKAASGDEGAWGAGEVRTGGQWSAPSPRNRRREETTVPPPAWPARVKGEVWRAWSPEAGTARLGARGNAEWRLDEARLTLSATQRVSYAASGARSLYRYAEADARLTLFPRGRATAWRAWNAEGPTRTGFFFGAEPAWDFAGVSLTLAPGLRVEVKTAEARETWESGARGGLRLRARRGWTIDAAGEVPVRTHGVKRGTRWHVTMSAGR